MGGCAVVSAEVRKEPYSEWQGCGVSTGEWTRKMDENIHSRELDCLVL